MTRFILIAIVCYSLPVIAYFIGLWFFRLTGKQGFETTPWLGISIAGILLTVVVLVVVIQNDGAPAGSHYVPSTFVDGERKPAYFVLPDGTYKYED